MLPKKLKVGTLTLPVIETKEIIVINGRECIGGVDCYEQWIKIKSSLGPDQKLQTLFHELIHAFAYERNISFPEEKVEMYCDELSRSIIQFIRDNKDFVKSI